MTLYMVLLKGVNVGKNHRIKMENLKRSSDSFNNCRIRMIS